MVGTRKDIDSCGEDTGLSFTTGDMLEAKMSNVSAQLTLDAVAFSDSIGKWYQSHRLYRLLGAILVSLEL